MNNLNPVGLPGFRVIHLIWTAVLVLWFNSSTCQITRPGQPLPWNYSKLKPLKWYSFHVSPEKKESISQPSGESRLKPAVSGVLLNIGYTPDNAGIWDTLEDGTRIWRIAFKVDSASLLSLICQPYHLEGGVKLFLYDSGQQHILGAFTDLNNKSTGMLATAYIPGTVLIAELQVPHYVESYGNLGLSGLGCDFHTAGNEKLMKDGWYGWSGDCNADIACFPQSSYQTVKNAVVRIVYNGTQRCTGTLVNNTQQDGRNYVLTAQHCIHTEASANTAVFYFRYESPYCDGPDGSNVRAVSGATLRATGTDLDFTLLELLEPVPVNYHAYYAGWDLSVIPPASAYTIHHPEGDVKKISIDEQPLTISTFSESYAPSTHWKISRWVTGTTEAGSSGAGLFDPMNKIRGTLTGGVASCQNSIDDYFEMISHDWQDSPYPESQLAYWLDPWEKGLTALNGYDPYGPFWASGDTLTNIGLNETIHPVKQGLSWGSWSGHDARQLTQFAEQFNTQSGKKMLGMILRVAGDYVTSDSSMLIAKVWKGGTYPGKVLYEKRVPLADFSPQSTAFVEFDSIIDVSDSFFSGYEIFYQNPVDTFSTDMAADRPAGAFSSAYVYDNQWYTLSEASEGDVYSSFGIMPVVYDSVPSNEAPLQPADFWIYPNPVQTLGWIGFRQVLATPVTLWIYSLQGQLMEKLNYGPYQRTLRFETRYLSSGVYIVRVQRGTRIDTAKLVVIRQAP